MAYAKPRPPHASTLLQPHRASLFSYHLGRTSFVPEDGHHLSRSSLSMGALDSDRSFIYFFEPAILAGLLLTCHPPCTFPIVGRHEHRLFCHNIYMAFLLASGCGCGVEYMQRCLEIERRSSFDSGRSELCSADGRCQAAWVGEGVGEGLHLAFATVRGAARTVVISPYSSYHVLTW